MRVGAIEAADLRNRLTPDMWRLAASLSVLAALGACSVREPGRKAILDQCIAGGMAEAVCECLATTSAEKLDEELFDVVVAGAKGEEQVAAAKLAELSPEMEARFSVLIPAIQQQCGAT